MVADELAVASISWFEPAWLAQNDRIGSSVPIRSWLQLMAESVRTIGVTPAIATTAAAFAGSFPWRSR